MYLVKCSFGGRADATALRTATQKTSMHPARPTFPLLVPVRGLGIALSSKARTIILAEAAIPV